MKIAYLSDYSPLDINAWSGTPYYVYQTLSQKHTVVWIGKDLFCGAYWYHKFNNKHTPFYPHDYSPEICHLLSEEIKAGDFDLVITSLYIMISCLDINIPIVYYSDIIYILCKDNYFPMTKELEYRAITREREALERADIIVFSSEIVKKAAIDFYGIPAQKIKVLEFGANIPDPQNIDLETYNTEICHLTFVGRDWKRKGGDMMIDIYKCLKTQGFNCDLTIIGSHVNKNINGINVIPFLDKNKKSDLEIYNQILRKSHFLVLPTNYDAFGIAICEASAYGVPSIATNVGGVSQALKDGINGYLVTKGEPAIKYASTIKHVFENNTLYNNLRKTTRQDFETRLNWNIWGQKFNAILEELINYYKNNKQHNLSASIIEDICIPVYAIHLNSRPERLKNLKKQFASKPEFDVIYIEATKHKNGAIGLWTNICTAIKIAQQRKDDLIILCEDDHEFTDVYTKKYLIANIVGAYRQNADILNCGIGGFGTAVPISPNRCWVDWFWCTQFVVLFSTIFPKILAYEFRSTDTADGVLSKISNNTQILYPPISKQKNYDYSDIMPHPSQSNFQNNLFSVTNQRLKIITDVYHRYQTPINNP